LGGIALASVAIVLLIGVAAYQSWRAYVADKGTGQRSADAPFDTGPTSSLPVVTSPASPPVLQAGQAVTLEVEVGKVLHADRSLVVRDLVQLFTNRLQAMGIEKRPNQPTVLRIRYQEREGGRVPIRNSEGHANDSTWTIRTTIGSAEVSLQTSDRPAPFVLSQFAVGGPDSLTQQTPPSFGRAGAGLTERHRQQMFASVLSKLRSVEIPYALPVDASPP
jgi:hypothetical protein